MASHSAELDDGENKILGYEWALRSAQEAQQPGLETSQRERLVSGLKGRTRDLRT